MRHMYRISVLFSYGIGCRAYHLLLYIGTKQDTALNHKYLQFSDLNMRTVRYPPTYPTYLIGFGKRTVGSGTFKPTV